MGLNSHNLQQAPPRGEDNELCSLVKTRGVPPNTPDVHGIKPTTIITHHPNVFQNPVVCVVHQPNYQYCLMVCSQNGSSTFRAMLHDVYCTSTTCMPYCIIIDVKRIKGNPDK